MHATCLHCTRSLGSNEVFETLPVGRRIAFDATQGRLWVVCRHCAKWNLVPFDTRLETIDAAERLFRETRTRYSTDNIGLARVPEGLELVRIGPALRPEFAAWRYRESHRRRRRRAMLGAGAGIGGAALIVAAFNVGMAAAGLGTGVFALAGTSSPIVECLLNRRLGLKVPSATPGRVGRIGLEQLRLTTIAWTPDGPVLDVVEAVTLRDGMVHSFVGPQLRSMGRRVLAAMNRFAGSRKQIGGAVDIIETHQGDLLPFMHEAANGKVGAGKGTRYPGLDAPRHWREYDGPYLKLAEMPTDQRLAVELWMNEDIERTWLEGELKLLEREWREADQLAKIADQLALERNPTGDATAGWGT